MWRVPCVVEHSMAAWLVFHAHWNTPCCKVAGTLPLSSDTLALLSLANGCEQKRWAPSRQKQLTCSSPRCSFSLPRVQLRCRWRLGPFHLGLQGSHRAVLICTGCSMKGWGGRTPPLLKPYNLRILTDVRNHMPLGAESATNESSVVANTADVNQGHSHNPRSLGAGRPEPRAGGKEVQCQARPGNNLSSFPILFCFL